MHRIRLSVDFDAPVTFHNLQEFVDNQRQKHPQFNWVGNSIFKDIQFFDLNKETISQIEKFSTEMVDLLLIEKLMSISRTDGKQQANQFDKWQDDTD